MDKQATYDDAQLLLQLYDLRREDRMRRARSWFTANFKARTMEELAEACPPGSEENASFRMVLSYWDMAASFVNNGILNAELFFQNGRELLLVWEKSRDLIGPIRETYGDQTPSRNLETVAGRFIEWLEKQSPGAYAHFSKRVRGE